MLSIHLASFHAKSAMWKRTKQKNTNSALGADQSKWTKGVKMPLVCLWVDHIEHVGGVAITTLQVFQRTGHTRSVNSWTLILHIFCDCCVMACFAQLYSCLLWESHLKYLHLRVSACMCASDWQVLIPYTISQCDSIECNFHAEFVLAQKKKKFNILLSTVENR